MGTSICYYAFNKKGWFYLKKYTTALVSINFHNTNLNVNQVSDFEVRL
jgi:hypothetical protein